MFWFRLSGVLLVITGLVVLALPVYEINIIRDKLRIAMYRDGLPMPAQLLEWGPWTAGANGLVSVRETPARIIEYRIGRARTHYGNTKFPYDVTFFQARYAYPDGHTEVWFALGPEPLTRPRSYPWLENAALSAFVSGCALLIFGAWRRRRAGRPTKANKISTEV